ncbi:acetyl-coenzyme A carboxylase carboxyl transferase subunit beta, chloroplastic-like [Rutidosis leptorrhynchoides]|uniref:acetyl-coenzyme A carboxylase carboxyl transferase subunit beta, chloroplastic-like n=1 Tax=Rutidosis leptorrhynchoides TaxID=125765 RepID=UPI003A997BE8
MTIHLLYFHANREQENSMKRWWFNSMLVKKEFEHRCKLSKATGRLGPIENASESKDPNINDLDKNIQSWGGHDNSSNVDLFFGVKDIRNFISDDTFLVKDINGDSSIEEPYAEFLATWRFEANVDQEDYNSHPCIHFRHQNQMHHMTLAQFAMHLELYKISHVKRLVFKRGYTILNPIDYQAFWQTYTSDNEAWSSSKKASNFTNPVHHILHHLIAKTLHLKTQHGGAVTVNDMRLMHAEKSRSY